MPQLKIQTNARMPDDRREDFLKKASALLARSLEKPERYIMVSLDLSEELLFGGSGDPAASLELYSLGFPTEKANPLAKELSDFLEEEIGIPHERVFIRFYDHPRSLWGWNGATFE